MSKNLEWLRNLIGKNFHKYNDRRNETEDREDKMYYAGKVDGLYIALRLIDQLDEPEQTDTNVGLLKPIIPQFVAKWIVVAKSRHHTLLQAMEEYAPMDIKNWICKQYNSDLFGKAWSAYPNIEVEEEAHPILKAFDEKAEEFKKYSDFYRRIQEIRAAIEDVIEEEKQ